MILALLIQAAPIENTPYWTCLNRNTVRLERSGDEPRDIATAVLEACHTQEPQLAPELMAKVREKLMPKLVAKVVEIRATRAR